VTALARYMNMYRETARHYGYEATSDQVGWAVPTYCAETDEIAVREARPHIEFFFNKLLRMPQEMLLPPGYLSLASMQGVMAAKRALSTGNQTIEDMTEKGVFLCGSPATLREKLEKYQKDIGFGYLLPSMHFGSLPHELTMKSIELYAKEVIPYFRARDAQGAKATATA
jgi:alkanesulfonate monooxygenase SsuD/methylene tetrahydromethanopterin reductase-like flavin-dependent oxidoreductase (luciferase family)